MIEVKGKVLRAKYQRITDQVDSATEDEEDRVCRIDGLLVRAKWSCESIADSLTTLAAMPEEKAQRDDLLRGVATELTVLAELSSGETLPHGDWKKALAILQERTQAAISDGDDGAEAMTDLDLLIDRVERAEQISREALKSYFAFLAL
jgi:hypothetical protein